MKNVVATTVLFIAVLAVVSAVILPATSRIYADIIDPRLSAPVWGTSTNNTCTPDKIINTAKKYVGQKYKNNQTPFGNPDGAPWCAYFAISVYKQAGCIPIDESEGNSRKLMEWFAAYHIHFDHSYGANKGDIIVWKHKNKPRGHTGIVYSNNANNTMTLIEGNVNDGVVLRTYSYKSLQTHGASKVFTLYGFGRW